MSALPSSDNSDIEPDQAWKDALKQEIEDGLKSMVEDAKKNLNDELAKAPVSVEERERVTAEYHHAMSSIRTIATDVFRDHLERERQERRWAAGTLLLPLWSEKLKREQEDIENAIDIASAKAVKRETEEDVVNLQRAEVSPNEERHPHDRPSSTPPPIVSAAPLPKALPSQPVDATRRGPFRIPSVPPIPATDPPSVLHSPSPKDDHHASPLHSNTPSIAPVLAASPSVPPRGGMFRAPEHQAASRNLQGRDRAHATRGPREDTKAPATVSTHPSAGTKGLPPIQQRDVLEANLEPGKAWKDALKQTIEEELRYMVDDAKKRVDLPYSTSLLRDQNRINAQYNQTMSKIRTKATELFQQRLERERQKRRSKSRVISVFEGLQDPTDDTKALITKLEMILADKKQYRRLLAFRGRQAQQLLDLFQVVLDIPLIDTGFRRHLVVATQRLSRRTELYPTCYSLGGVELVGNDAITAGGFADIYKGRFHGQTVCLKVMRLYQTSDVEHFLKRFSAEAILWGQLSHPNLLPIYGLYRYTESRLCLVSPWMDNGDVNTYLKNHPVVDRFLLVSDIAAGVGYLHENGIIHGDLKGANILVNDAGRACLADFGLSSVSDDNILHWTSHSNAASKGGSMQWQGPELFDVEKDDIVPNSKASDVYAWSCVCYEIFTGKIPFFELPRDAVVIAKIQSGVRPSRPLPSSPAWHSWGLTESIWALMQACWSKNPEERPTMPQIIASRVSVDERPAGRRNAVSRARFRNSMGGRDRLPSIRELEAILQGVGL
ncbi:Serine/threonine-protein kinase STY8 [Hypsizygus marmoreus]|uniref:Serine/threonine-protein kinase STY8 n=1 Tax=Hypsizygus marmoreus TaxID=39966 RepID=A0A369JD99_HYPMA|nr:Serine/threonine-protein kinase STY8 [Hypsizygus marmoreus]